MVDVLTAGVLRVHYQSNWLIFAPLSPYQIIYAGQPVDHLHFNCMRLELLPDSTWPAND